MAFKGAWLYLLSYGVEMVLLSACLCASCVWLSPSKAEISAAVEIDIDY